MSASNFSPKSVFITGASRGLGLEFVKQFCKLPSSPKHIFATCRNPTSAKDLQAVASSHPIVHVLKLDVTDYKALPDIVKQVKAYVGDDGLTLLLNNAGVIKRQGFEDVTPEDMRDNYETNCIAPVMLMQHLAPLLRGASAKYASVPMGCSRAAIVSISTGLASISSTMGIWNNGNRIPYRCSKYALNIASKCASVDLLPDKVATYLLHPGWVATDMGGPKADETPEMAVGGMMKMMASFGPEENGKHYAFDGRVIPW